MSVVQQHNEHVDTSFQVSCQYVKLFMTEIGNIYFLYLLSGFLSLKMEVWSTYQLTFLWSITFTRVRKKKAKAVDETSSQVQFD